MKRILNYLTAAVLVMLLVPAQLLAAPTVAGATIPISPVSESAKIDAMVARLNEIKDMDKSNLSSAERRELRKEVRGIKDSVKDSGGVYISVGAIIIIILLLIILL